MTLRPIDYQADGVRAQGLLGRWFKGQLGPRHSGRP